MGDGVEVRAREDASVGREPSADLLERSPLRCSVAWCVGCGHAHGFGWCAHAMRLTQRHLERRGVAFNWR